MSDRTTDTSNMAKALRGEPVEITLPRLVEMREQAIAGATYTPGLPGWMHWHWVAALNEVIAKRAAPEPAPATTDRVAPSFDAWWNDDAYGCLRYSDPVQFDRLRQAFNAGVAAARAAPEPDGMQVALDRACHTIMELMQAYERRIRSDCTTPEQLAAKPWECAEYIRGARYLKAVWKDGRAQPFAALDEFLGYLRSSETKDGHHG